jgi:hypothetical protein
MESSVIEALAELPSETLFQIKLVPLVSVIVLAASRMSFVVISPNCMTD